MASQPLGDEGLCITVSPAVVKVCTLSTQWALFLLQISLALGQFAVPALLEYPSLHPPLQAAGMAIPGRIRFQQGFYLINGRLNTEAPPRDCMPRAGLLPDCDCVLIRVSFQPVLDPSRDAPEDAERGPECEPRGEAFMSSETVGWRLIPVDEDEQQDLRRKTGLEQCTGVSLHVDLDLPLAQELAGEFRDVAEGARLRWMVSIPPCHPPSFSSRLTALLCLGSLCLSHAAASKLGIPRVGGVGGRRREWELLNVICPLFASPVVSGGMP